jgi:phosphopantetheinyl transferase
MPQFPTGVLNGIRMNEPWNEPVRIGCSASWSMGEEISVRRLVVRGEQVLVACAAAEKDEKRRPARYRAARHLALTLWHRFLLEDKGSRPIETSEDETVSIDRDALGKPAFTVRGMKAAAVSFSHGLGTTWAAFAGRDVYLGIDVAESAEFEGNYPFHRVFHKTEFDADWECSRGTGHPVAPKHFPCVGHPRASSCAHAAFLWSVKEAVVKALGCGFHRIDPLDVRISVQGGKGELIESTACLTGRARDRFPMVDAPRGVAVSFQQGSLWVSTAVVSGVG